MPPVRKKGVAKKAERSLKEWKQQNVNVKHIYGKVMLAKEIDNMTSNFERKLIVSIKTHLQWRV